MDSVDSSDLPGDLDTSSELCTSDLLEESMHILKSADSLDCRLLSVGEDKSSIFMGCCP